MLRITSSLTTSFIGIFLLVVSLSPLCSGQVNHLSFDPDETNARKTAVIDALKLICPQEELSRNGDISGCRHCPPQTTEGDAEDLDWELKRSFTGHFTGPKENNLVVSGRGCEPHSESFGGTFVFNVRGSTVSYLHYDVGVITENCHKFEIKRGSDLLVCTDDWGAQESLWSYVYSVGFSRDGQSNVGRIFEVEDNSRNDCGVDFINDAPTSVQKSEIVATDFTLERDGQPHSLEITATVGEKTPTAAERTACQEEGTPISLTLQRYDLSFLFNGKTFQATTTSEAALKAFPKPEFPY